MICPCCGSQIDSNLEQCPICYKMLQDTPFENGETVIADKKAKTVFVLGLLALLFQGDLLVLWILKAFFNIIRMPAIGYLLADLLNLLPFAGLILAIIALVKASYMDSENEVNLRKIKSGKTMAIVAIVLFGIGLLLAVAAMIFLSSIIALLFRPLG